MKAKTTPNVEGTCMSLKEYQLLYNELEDNVAGKKNSNRTMPKATAISEKGLVLFLLVSLCVLYY